MTNETDLLVRCVVHLGLERDRLMADGDVNQAGLVMALIQDIDAALAALAAEGTTP